MPLIECVAKIDRVPLRCDSSLPFTSAAPRRTPRRASSQLMTSQWNLLGLLRSSINTYRMPQ